MDNITPASPISSNGSDSDACNEDSPRVYFGPLKTPERKFIAASKNLFPPPQPTMVRRSPRLSSPRIRSASPMDVRALEEDMRDIEHVAQLVNDSDEEVKDSTESGMGTPQGDGDFMPDEPSSVLADKISHALDNPSPPPSPPSTLRIFDPYHTMATDGPADYHTELMSLRINDGLETPDENPMFGLSRDPQPILISTAAATVHEQLIDLGASSPLRMQNDVPMDIHSEAAVQPMLSVDDLLSQSPSFHITPTPSHPIIPDVNMNIASSLTDDSSNLSDKQIFGQDAIQLIVTPTTQPEDMGIENDMSDRAQSMAPGSSNEGLTTPLRRSTRPRRSVTPTPITTVNSNPPDVITIPSLARTQVKKKLSTPSHNEEIVEDSQDEQEDIRRSPSPSNTATTIRVRHRSPGKTPLSFRRELGSLSPSSSNVLSTLGFNALTGPSAEVPGKDQILPSSQPVFSFSVFTPPTEAPSTPARSTGPIRFSSPPKSSTLASPNKFRIQVPAIGDPTNTPARRIPIAQAVAQGQISPEKAVQLGLMPNGSPLPSLSTPARRVLISDNAAPTLMKSSNLRPASPLKKVSGQREPSTEPSQRFASSLKGKEKAPQASQERTTAFLKLPFPLVDAASTSSSLSTGLKVPPQDNDKPGVKSSPAKSLLKQPTSRIPRIGVKPYARVESKVAQKKPTIRASKTTESVKPTPRVAAADSAALARANAREAASNLAASTSRAKQTTSTLTTVLKRKREVEVASPTKPRVIMLRQVPPMAAPPIETLQITQPPAPTSNPATKSKKAAPMRMRRVMDPEPTVTTIPSSSQTPTALQRESSPSSSSPAQQPTSEAPASSTLPPLPLPADNQDPPPGSPMIQDTTVDITAALETPTKESNITSDTANDNFGESASLTSGLRRTTRSRRAAPTRDIFTEGSSRTTSTRRKPIFRSDDIFSGMSMTALKDLTVSNTVKNQKYVAAKLETEVVRKEGIRPESPAVKIRTIVQRQQDERDRRREERANRRARRSGEDIPSSDAEGAGPLGYSSGGDDAMSEDEGGSSPIRHVRGAGEDDDYQTPDRYKHIKGVRLFGAGPDEKVEPAKRRVKWDRGLFTTVYLDEVKLGTRQTSLKENRALKSILAPTAKALQLDTLGNLPHAESPLSDIIQENITVKKIVYDSDITAPVVEVVTAAKSTRSKSKK